jgi:hypothetical protein
MHRVLSLVAVLLSATAVVEAQDTELAPGPELLAPFKQDLQQALRNGLAQGPVEAIAACRLKAPEITDALSRDGVRLGRTSHHLRNPSNAGPDWVVAILETYANNPSDRAPRTVSLGDHQSGYVEPIIIPPLCLTCHGDDMAPDVAARIRELYPADQAVGYQVGDLRGVFWVEFPNPE